MRFLEGILSKFYLAGTKEPIGNKKYKQKKRYLAIMFLCFLYGGFSIILFLLQLYSAYWVTDIAGVGFSNDGNFFDTNKSVDSNIDFNHLAQPRRSSDIFPRVLRDPFAVILSPISLSYFFSGIIALLAGIAIWNLSREKEISHVKREMANNLLLPDEKKIIDSLKESNYESTQSKLVRETGLSKVQVHRTIKRLEAKGVLEKHNYGLTNKIILKKELFE